MYNKLNANYNSTGNILNLKPLAVCFKRKSREWLAKRTGHRGLWRKRSGIMINEMKMKWRWNYGEI